MYKNKIVKKNTIRLNNPNNFKVIFILLVEIIVVQI